MKRAMLLLTAALLLAGCAATPYDYGAYLDHMPRSILVLPPLDESPEVDASNGWLGTVSEPLAERGYYVFPVALVDRILRENGLPTPYEMHQVPLDKLREVFGADAVLYVTIHRWGTDYEVISSNTVVAYSARLVDAGTGATIWQGNGRAVRSSSDGGGGLLANLIAALFNQISTSVVDPTPGVAVRAHEQAFWNPANGLLIGPYDPGFEQDQQRRRDERAQRAADAGAPR